MALRMFHRVLIGASILLFAIDGARQTAAARAGAGPGAARRAAAELAAAVLLALYFRTLFGRRSRAARKPGGHGRGPASEEGR